MSAQQILFTLVIFLHDLFTAVWIGGMITLGITVLPSARKALGAGPQTRQLMETILERLSVLVYISIPVLIVTGILMAKRTAQFSGLFSFSNAYSGVMAIKHILVIVMVVIAVVRSSGMKKNKGQAVSPSREKMSVKLLFINIILGVLVLLASGFSAALSA